MEITLKLYASLAAHLPDKANRNEIVVEVEDGASVMDVLSHYQLPQESCHLILINGVFHPLALASQTQLKPGDSLAVWPPVAGG